MPRITVDTELLKRKARRLEELSHEFEKAGNELAYQSNRVPSYGGQLSIPAHRAGVVAQYDANTLRDLLKNHADQLAEIARRFEEVDGEAVQKLNSWDLLLQGLGDLIALPALNPFLDIDLEALYGNYHQHQLFPDGCADFSLSMVCNIYYGSRGESTERCDVDKITQYLESIFVGKFPWEYGGTTPWGIGFGLDSLEIPNSFHPDGSLETLEDALRNNQLVVISIGRINDPEMGGQTWGHVMVIVGEEGDDFIVLDPGYDPKDGGPKTRRIPKQELLGKWWYPPFHPCWIIG